MTEASGTAVPTSALDPALVESKRKPLFYASAITSVLLLVLLGLGIAIALDNHGVRDVHAGISYLATVSAVVAAVLGYGYAKAAGKMGTFGHAVSLPILMLIQTALGSMGFEVIHIILGVLIALGTFGLTMMTSRKGRVA